MGVFNSVGVLWQNKSLARMQGCCKVGKRQLETRPRGGHDMSCPYTKEWDFS